MKYTIYSVDDERYQYKMKLRSKLRKWDEVSVNCVDGRVPAELAKAVSEHGIEIVKPDIRVGQLGVWYTFLNALDEAPLVTFDDDAIVCDNFTDEFWKRAADLPSDTDFFSLFLPRDSDDMASPSNYFGKHLTTAYARYGGVSFFFTKKGALKIKAAVRRDGIFAQYDDQIYHYNKVGLLRGYASQPELPDLVYITGNELSIAQGTEIYHG
jgi:hypothetical protein